MELSELDSATNRGNIQDDENIRGNGIPPDQEIAKIQELPFEVLLELLEFSVPVDKRRLTIDERSSMSVQSAVSVESLLAEGKHRLSDMDIKDWSKVCWQFEDAALRWQFARIAIRCSEEGLAELDNIIQVPDQVKYVKKFSYMIYSYSSLERWQFENYLKETREEIARIESEIAGRKKGKTVSNPGSPYQTDHQLRIQLVRSKENESAIINMMHRSEEQRRIMEGKRDEIAIRDALKAFDDRLQQIRLLRVEDDVERKWQAFARTRPEIAAESMSSRWAAACKHAVAVLDRAFQKSTSRPPRISGRALPPQTLVPFITSLQTTPYFALRVKCMELQFDDRSNLDEELLGLSELFRRGFSAVVNLQGLHISFARPVSLPFDSIFHEVHWQDLRHIGFASLRLTSDHIIGLVRLHKSTLQSVRLRSVYLTDGSRWIDVLRTFRLNLSLKWVSLRAVGYSGQEPPIPVFRPESESDGDANEDDQESEDESLPATGEIIFEERTPSVNGEAVHMAIDAVDDLLDGTESDSSSGSEDSTEEGDDQSAGLLSYASHHDDETTSDLDSHESIDTDNSEQGESDNEHGIEHQAMSSQTPDTQPVCSCKNGFGWADLIDDDGENPSKELWKWWQIWVINRCPTHDQAAALLD